MVRKSSAYIGLISHRYGQVPRERNPSGYSITRLEFEEARRLGLPTLIFVMSDEHPVKKADIETEASNIEKLREFADAAKSGRIYIAFDSLEDFVPKAIHAVGPLRRYLEEISCAEGLRSNQQVSHGAASEPLPKAPDFYAEPPYIGSHQFVGRRAQLETINDWASAADAHPVLLFEAIGGSGKSILTWEWVTKNSTSVRADWAGKFWYSFYERGATMLDFCRRALAYMTGSSRSAFRDRNTLELTRPLIRQLQARPWLLVLDGLERVLVSYHRSDAAQAPDHLAGIADQIARRDPCAAINPEDDDVLRALTAAAPSKLLLTSRLTPRVLLNQSSQPIPGVLRETLPGLRTADADALIRSCGVTGDSDAIQHYLKSHCDCHPLVIGVLAGLVNDYLPARGNFDAWFADSRGGGQLNFASLNLVQKRNHILSTALDALPPTGRQLLSTLALMSSSIDWETLCAVNPSLPPLPERVLGHSVSDDLPSEGLAASRADAIRAGTPELIATVRDLEKRGLLQYDPTTRKHDLHPVVRAVAASGLEPEETSRLGQRVIDYFSQQYKDPFAQIDSLDGFDNARHLVRVLLHMGKTAEARRFVLQRAFSRC